MSDVLPRLVGSGKWGACSEIHTFFAPVLTDADMDRYDEVVNKYKAAVQLWNERERPRLQERDGDRVRHGEMKAPVLTLVFRDGAAERPVTVCQSARYVFCNDAAQVRQLCAEDAAFFAAQGLQVIREKIEASAFGVDGVPQTAQEAALWPQLYFEFHIKLQHVDSKSAPEPITAKEERELRALADRLSRELGTPIPLSYNREKNANNADNGGCQRFLNVRFYGQGMREIGPQLDAIKRAIAQDYVVLKVISEWVWYDTNKAMDHGWIDYSFDELAALQARLASNLPRLVFGGAPAQEQPPDDHVDWE